jgi:hypothetical protein
MASICESWINVVIKDKPKMLTGLTQKGKYSSCDAPYTAHADRKSTGGHMEPGLFVVN